MTDMSASEESPDQSRSVLYAKLTLYRSSTNHRGGFIQHSIANGCNSLVSPSSHMNEYVLRRNKHRNNDVHKVDPT